MKSVCVCVWMFLCMYVCLRQCACVCMCNLEFLTTLQSLFLFFSEPNVDFVLELEINRANLRQIHDSHYGDESRQLRILTFIYVSERDVRNLTLSVERFSWRMSLYDVSRGFLLQPEAVPCAFFLTETEWKCVIVKTWVMDSWPRLRRISQSVLRMTVEQHRGKRHKVTPLAFIMSRCQKTQLF